LIEREDGKNMRSLNKAVSKTRHIEKNKMSQLPFLEKQDDIRKLLEYKSLLCPFT
jgi:hypothetical protein